MEGYGNKVLDFRSGTFPFTESVMYTGQGHLSLLAITGWAEDTIETSVLVVWFIALLNKQL